MTDPTHSEVALPIARVVVLEDRAQIDRRGELKLEKGISRLSLHGVAAAAVERSLKVEVTGGKVLEARLHRRWRPRPAGGLREDASELRKTVKALGLQTAAIGDEQGQLTARRERLLKARADLWREINEATGFGRVDAGSWSSQLEALSAEEARLDHALREVQVKAAAFQRQLHDAQRALSVGEQREQEFACTLELLVESPGGTLPARVSYLVPCAVWRPSYRAVLGAESVSLECEAVVWQRTGEAWNDVQLAFSTARPTLGTRPPALVEDRLRIRPRQEQEKRVVSVSVREEVIQTTGEGGAEPSAELPGLDDGGEAQLLQAPAKASVPSDGQPHRVYLSKFEAKASAERLCSPELTPLVSMVAKFSNEGPHVLLAGPVDLLRTSGFIGRGQLKFAGLKETAALSFGSEDGMRVVRESSEKTEEARLTGRRTTRREVKLFVSNASPQATNLVLEERVPVSEVKEVEVQVVTRECKPAPSVVSDDGVARIVVECAPNSTQQVRFVWELSAAAKVAGV